MHVVWFLVGSLWKLLLFDPRSSKKLNAQDSITTPSQAPELHEQMVYWAHIYFTFDFIKMKQKEML